LFVIHEQTLMPVVLDSRHQNRNEKETVSPRMIKLSDFRLEKIIGEGATSTVYSAVSDKNEEVAVKIIPKNEENSRMARKEVEALAGIDHENIIRVFGQFESKRHIYIVSELCEFNLVSFLNEYEVDEEIALKIIRMVLCAVSHIHHMGIIHRDIKLGNILLKGNTAKICDFGLSCYSHNHNNTFCGTVDYIAPEVARKEEYGTSADIWSVGAVFYVLLTKRKFNVNQEPPSCSPDVLGLLYSLLDPKPEKRPTADEALTHPCFRRFMPLFLDFRLIEDFERNTRYGILRKRGDSITLKNVGIKIMGTERKRDGREDVLDTGKRIHPTAGCSCATECIYGVFVNGARTRPEFMTNGELKGLLVIEAYIKSMKQKIPKVVIEEDGARFYYTLSNGFVYVTDAFKLTQRDGRYEISTTRDGKTLRAEYDRIPGFVDRGVHRMIEQCKRMDESTCWSSEKLPVTINCQNPQPLSISCISQVTEMSLGGRVLYRHKSGLGWCIKTSLNFMFLLDDGERFELLGKDAAVVYRDKRYAIDNSLSRALKRNIRKVACFLEEFVK
jgi:serine/threonine-protein kinase RIO1